MSEDIGKLEAEYDALLKEKVEKMKKEKVEHDKIEAEKLEKAKEDAMRIKIRDEVTAELNKKTDAGLSTDGNLKKTKRSETVEFAVSYAKNKKLKAPKYGSSEWRDGIEFTYSNEGCEYDLDDWTKEGVFANVIWQSFYCKGLLAGRVTVRGIDFQAGEGCNVMIRTVGKRTAQGPLASCECLSCATNTFGKHEISLSRYGDFTTLCEKDLFCVGDEVKSRVVEAMAGGLAELVDKEIWDALEEATPGYDETLARCCDREKDDCCLLAFDIYDATVALEARMRGSGLNPDYVIMHSTIAAFFKYRESGSKLAYPLDVSVTDGILTRIGKLKVIEFCGANECESDATDSVVAIVIDSSRAVGEAWGKRPITEQERNIQCDSTDIAMHMYLGIAALDTNAIGHIKTPGSCPS